MSTDVGDLLVLLDVATPPRRSVPRRPLPELATAGWALAIAER